MNSRHTLRLSMRQERRQLSPLLCQYAALQISRYIALAPWFQESRHVAFYWPMPGEIDTLALMQYAWQAGKSCYLPICCEPACKLLFAPYYPGDTLAPNRYSIPEPPHLSNLSPALDLIFTPLLAFDHYGYRLGSGKGYYDRTFADLQLRKALLPKRIGLAYGFQEVPQLDTEPWDIPLHQIIIFDTTSGQVQEMTAQSVEYGENNER